MEKGGSHLLIHDSQPLSHPDTHGSYAILRIALLHFVYQCSGDPGPAAAERMSYRNGAAVHIHDGWIESQVANAGKALRGKSLVELCEPDVLCCKACPCQGFLRGRHR